MAWPKRMSGILGGGGGVYAAELDADPVPLPPKDACCGARPARGQKLGFAVDDYRIATGEERCVNGKDCDGEHYEPAADVHWTNRAEFVDCDACDVLVDKSPGYILALDGEDWRKGILCDACAAKHNGVEMVWRGDRLVRKSDPDPRIQRWVDAAERMEARPTLAIYSPRDDGMRTLAEGPMRVERTANGARLTFNMPCTMTGTADSFSVTTHDRMIACGRVGAGPTDLRLGTASLCNGWSVIGALNLSGLSEEQLRAMGIGPREDVVNLRDFIGVPAEPMRSRIVFNGEDGGIASALATLDDDGSFSCACGSADPATHADGCKLPWQYRSACVAAALCSGGWADVQKAVAGTLLGASAVALLSWCLRLWAASPAGQIAARDAAVARAIADVPAGCDGERWANVVRVIAALGAECGAPMQEQIGWLGHRTRIFAPLVAAYAAERRAGYSREQAALRATAKLGGAANASWLFAAYEAGR